MNTRRRSGESRRLQACRCAARCVASRDARRCAGGRGGGGRFDRGISSAGPVHAAAAAGAAPVSEPLPALTATTFANPPSVVRPKYRWWMPLAATDDQELRTELQQMKDAGPAGPRWPRSPVPGSTARRSSLDRIRFARVDAQGRGHGGCRQGQRHHPRPDDGTELASDGSLDDEFNQTGVAQQLIFGREFNAAGTTRSGTLPATTTNPPTITALCSRSRPATRRSSSRR